MLFEIAIEGPAFAVAEVRGRLGISSKKMEIIPSHHEEEEERKRIVINEQKEDRLDDLLLSISRTMAEVEKAIPLEGKLEIRVRKRVKTRPCYCIVSSQAKKVYFFAG